MCQSQSTDCFSEPNLELLSGFLLYEGGKILLFRGLAIQTVGHRLTVSSSGSELEMQNLRPHHRPPKYNVYFNKKPW